MSNLDLPQDVMDLTDIPTFLRAGHPDRDRALAEGAARLAANPPPRPRARRAEPAGYSDPDRARPTQVTKRALQRLGWSSGQVERVNRTEAEFAASRGLGPQARFASKRPKDPDDPGTRVAGPRKRPRRAAGPKTPRVLGYKGHLAGSRKARVHECYDAKGEAAAVGLGKELELKDGTVKSWVKGWQKEDHFINGDPIKVEKVGKED